MFNVLKRLFEPKSNAFEAALLTTSVLNVEISATTLKKEIEEHPDFPSLLSISDVFSTYGIENLGAKIRPDEFSGLSFPFIAQVKGNKTPLTYFSVIRSVEGSQVTFSDPEDGNWVTADMGSFSTRYAGVALLVAKSAHAGEKDYWKIRAVEIRRRWINYLAASFVPLIIVFLGAGSLFSNGSNAITPFIFLLLSLFGCIVGGLLLWYEVDLHNPLLKQICSGGKKTDCGAVLRSEGATIFGISWSVIGFSYFAGLMLFLIFSGLTDSAGLSAITLIGSAAGAYIVFSVYYQWRVVRQWCKLCLTVQAVLAMQLIVVFFISRDNGIFIPEMNISLTVRLIASFTIPFFTAAILLPFAKRTKEYQQLNLELQRMKHSPQIFEALMSKQKAVQASADGLGITIGNPQAKNTLIKVCAPYCGPCSKAHPLIEQLIENNPDIKLQIIFNAYGHGYDTNSIPAKHLLAINESGGEDMIKRALDDWYSPEVKDYESFAAKYNMVGNIDHQLEKINAMRDWCDETDITFTPTFFFNGLQLPDNYSVADLKYFLSV